MMHGHEKSDSVIVAGGARDAHTYCRFEIKSFTHRIIGIVGTAIAFGGRCNTVAGA
jgi:hypothetical protein